MGIEGALATPSHKYNTRTQRQAAPVASPVSQQVAEVAKVQLLAPVAPVKANSPLRSCMKLTAFAVPVIAAAAYAILNYSVELNAMMNKYNPFVEKQTGWFY